MDHAIMLLKLKYYNIHDHELLLFKNYFINRKQFIQIDQFKGLIGFVEYHVSQWLRPFTIFILFECLSI